MSSLLEVLAAISDNKIIKSRTYADFEGLNHVDCNTEIVSKSKSEVFMTTEIPKIRPESFPRTFRRQPCCTRRLSRGPPS